ncbi:MAG: hypothetical protein ACFE9T_15775 [Promethearchaeota archaeon]
MSDLVYSIFEAIIIAFGVFSLIPVYKNWKESKNRMFIAIFAYIIGVIGYSFINILTFFLGVDTNVYLVGGLRFGYVLGYMLFTIQFVFMLYLRGLTRLYTLPFIVAFYLMMGNILHPSTMPFIIYATIVSYTPAYFLLRDGKRKRNGLAFGMGLFFLIWGIGQSIPVEMVMEIFRAIAIYVFFLGTRGFYEKYIFVNQEEEQKILGTWIAKFVAKE